MVLSGSLYLYFGKERFRLKKGDCFMFKPNKTHMMKNTGKTTARVLWISTPPTF